MKDGDYDVCSEDPKEEFGLMCESCTTDSEEERETGNRGDFSADQLKTIAQLEDADDEG